MTEKAFADGPYEFPWSIIFRYLHFHLVTGWQNISVAGNEVKTLCLSLEIPGNALVAKTEGCVLWQKDNRRKFFIDDIPFGRSLLRNIESRQSVVEGVRGRRQNGLWVEFLA